METKSSVIYPDCKDLNSFESGLQFQDFVIDLLMRELGFALSNYSSRRWQFEVGENRQGIEIKLDRRILETGNISIEVAEKSKSSNSKFIPSGIMREDNTWLYIQGNPDIIFIFAKTLLRGLYKSGKYRINEMPTIQRFLLPIKDAEAYAAKVIKLK